MLPLDVTFEIPIARRKYESAWTIPPGARRYCVCPKGRACYSEVAASFAEILINIGGSGTSVLLECVELYMREKKLKNILARPILDLPSTGVSCDMLTLFQQNRAVVLREDNYYFALLCTSRDDVKKYICSLQPFEFYITYWINEVPVPVLFELWNAGHDTKPERHFLERLGRYDPLVFFAPNHEHMEIMVLDSVLGDRIANYLRQLCAS